MALMVPMVQMALLDLLAHLVREHRQIVVTEVQVHLVLLELLDHLAPLALDSEEEVDSATVQATAPLEVILLLEVRAIEALPLREQTLLLEIAAHLPLAQTQHVEISVSQAQAHQVSLVQVVTRDRVLQVALELVTAVIIQVHSPGLVGSSCRLIFRNLTHHHQVAVVIRWWEASCKWLERTYWETVIRMRTTARQVIIGHIPKRFLRNNKVGNHHFLAPS